MDLKGAEALAAIVREGAFDKAADRLCISQSAVSQRIRQLEQTVGQLLIVRSQPPVLTEAGKVVMQGYRQIELIQREMEKNLGLREGKSRQKVAIGTNADSLALWLLDALQPTLDKTRLLLDLRVDDQETTHELLRRGEVIGCITAQDKAEKGCNCFPIGVMTYRCLISPSFRQRHFALGVTADAIAQAPCVEFNEKDTLERQYLSKWFGLEAPRQVHRIPSTEMFMSFIEKGNAWGLVPDMQSVEARQQGKVEELVPEQTIQVPLYWHIWNLKTALNRELTQAITRFGRCF